MREDQKPNSAPMPMPAPQLPNIPISPDDPFQSDPDLLPPVTPPERDRATGGQPPGRRSGQTPRRNDPDDFEIAPDGAETALYVEPEILLKVRSAAVSAAETKSDQ